MDIHSIIFAFIILCLIAGSTSMMYDAYIAYTRKLPATYSNGNAMVDFYGRYHNRLGYEMILTEYEEYIPTQNKVYIVPSARECCVPNYTVGMIHQIKMLLQHCKSDKTETEVLNCVNEGTLDKILKIISEQYENNYVFNRFCIKFEKTAKIPKEWLVRESIEQMTLLLLLKINIELHHDCDVNVLLTKNVVDEDHPLFEEDVIIISMLKSSSATRRITTHDIMTSQWVFNITIT